MPPRPSGPRLGAVESPCAVSANPQRPCAVLRSRCSHGRLEKIRSSYSTSPVVRVAASKRSTTAEPALDDWPLQRDKLISCLSYIDSQSSVLRTGALLNSYSILLDCSEETSPKACGHVLRCEKHHVSSVLLRHARTGLEQQYDTCRTPILDVIVESMLSSSARHQCAAVGMLSFLLLGCGGLQDASLLFATFQDMLPWKHTVTLSLQSCSSLLRHDEPQVWLHNQNVECLPSAARSQFTAQGFM